MRSEATAGNDEKIPWEECVAGGEKRPEDGFQETYEDYKETTKGLRKT